MKKKVLQVLQYLFFLGLGLLLLWWTTRNLSAEEISYLKDSLKSANYLLVIPAMVFLLLAHYSRALRWKILMDPSGFQPSTVNTFIAVMLGYFFNLLVPRLGEVMKCTILARYEKTPVDRLIGTMVAERAIDLICLILIILITVLIQMDTVGDFTASEFRKWIDNRKGTGSTGRTAFLIIMAALGVTALVVLRKKFAHLTIVKKLFGIVRGVWLGIISVGRVQRKNAFILHTIFIWTMYLLSIRIGFYALEPVAHLGIRPSFTILSFGSLAMIVTQGGIGAYQLAVQKTMTLYGISEVDGLAYGWLLWAVQTIMVLVIGIICLLLLPVVNRRPIGKPPAGVGG